jgi:putative phosphoribosyl transferase
MFYDRRQAGKRLAEKLLRYKDEQPVILALPRGGVPVAFEVAMKLRAPLDIVIVRKLGAPGQKELAIGALVEAKKPLVFLNNYIMNALQVNESYLEEEIANKTEEMKRRQKMYRGEEQRTPLKNKTVIVVDDGIATGASMRAALMGLRADEPKKIILAVPVAPPDIIEELEQLVDEVVCLETPAIFFAVGEHYTDFSQTTDDEVIALLDEAKEQLQK